MSRITGFTLGLVFAILILNKLDQNKIVDALNRNTSEITDLKETQKYLEIDVANLKITRTSTMEEVEKIVKDAIIADNMEEDEYNSLVAETIMNIENNVQLIGAINKVQAELIKRQVIKELKKE